MPGGTFNLGLNQFSEDVSCCLYCRILRVTFMNAKVFVFFLFFYSHTYCTQCLLLEIFSSGDNSHWKVCHIFFSVSTGGSVKYCLSSGYISSVVISFQHFSSSPRSRQDSVEISHSMANLGFVNKMFSFCAVVFFLLIMPLLSLHTFVYLFIYF